MCSFSFLFDFSITEFLNFSSSQGNRINSELMTLPAIFGVSHNASRLGASARARLTFAFVGMHSWESSLLRFVAGMFFALNFLAKIYRATLTDMAERHFFIKMNYLAVAAGTLGGPAAD